MEELKKILLTHAERYPLMEPADAVKLIYQNEFGGGHMIRDEQACLDYLRREYESVVPNSDVPLCEPIGNGIVRVYLAALKQEDLERLGTVFIRSANEHSGTKERFLKKLEVLCQLTKDGVFSFGAEAMETYLYSYREAGYHPVSHSHTYREAYHPAYRVVLSRLWE